MLWWALLGHPLAAVFQLFNKNVAGVMATRWLVMLRIRSMLGTVASPMFEQKPAAGVVVMGACDGGGEKHHTKEKQWHVLER